MASLVILSATVVIFLLVTLLSSTGGAAKCGHVDSCDYLISYSVFQKGACGRVARCYWELLHLDLALNNDKTREAVYTDKIKNNLCRIPTLGTYNNLRAKDSTLEPYYPCGPPPPEPDNTTTTTGSPAPPQPPPPPEFLFYPMTTLYTYNENTGSGKHEIYKYLKRMEDCTSAEYSCNSELQQKIDELCDMLDHATLKSLEKKFNMRIRNKRFYEIVILHPEVWSRPDYNMTIHFSRSTGLREFNNCSLLQFRRKRIEDGEHGDPSNGVPSFEDVHAFNEIDTRLRGPYFDLYLLYAADPKNNLQNYPAEERWWNETKAYQKLAHFLPKDMMEDISNAIQCVYERVDSEDMQWRPEKFCWSSSTFTCVDSSKIITNDCKGNAYKDARHDFASKEVPK